MRADEEQWQKLMEDKEQLDAELRLLKCQEVRFTISVFQADVDSVCIASTRTLKKGRNQSQGRSGKVPKLDQDTRGEIKKDGGWQW